MIQRIKPLNINRISERSFSYLPFSNNFSSLRYFLTIISNTDGEMYKVEVPRFSPQNDVLNLACKIAKTFLMYCAQ